MARARKSADQWSLPVCSANAAGTVTMWAPAAESAVKLAKANVVANTQADAPIDGHRYVPHRHPGAMCCDSQKWPRAGQHQTGGSCGRPPAPARLGPAPPTCCRHVAQSGPASGKPPAMMVMCVACGHFAQGCQKRVMLQGLGPSQSRCRRRADEAEILRQHREFGSRRCRVSARLGRLRQVARHILGGGHLNRGNGEGDWHASRLPLVVVAVVVFVALFDAVVLVVRRDAIARGALGRAAPSSRSSSRSSLKSSSRSSKVVVVIVLGSALQVLPPWLGALSVRLSEPYSAGAKGRLSSSSRSSLGKVEGRRRLGRDGALGLFGSGRCHLHGWRWRWSFCRPSCLAFCARAGRHGRPCSTKRLGAAC